MSLTSISDYEIITYLVSPAGGIIPVSTMQAIIGQWEARLNSDFTNLIVGNSALPATTTYPATSPNTERYSVINWEVMS